MDIWSLPESKEEAVKLIQEHDILCTQRKLKNGYDTKLYFGNSYFGSVTQKIAKKK